MLFNSYNFIFIFLPAVLLLLFVARRVFPLRAAIWLTGLASLIFYAVWDVRFLPLLLGSIFMNYAVSKRIAQKKEKLEKRPWLFLGIAANLCLLGYFKYAGFFLNNWHTLTGMSVPDVAIVLPIGISFFTFTQVAFLVDTFRKDHPHQYAFADYLLFVTFFPHLIAGPILIHKHVIPQFESPHFGRPSSRVAYAGLMFFCGGLFKKVMVADTLAPYVNLLYSASAHLSTLEAWMSALLYTLQLYFDFSGYSDMAVGLAMLMNVRIPINFNSPYRSASIIEFWRRWHISLSRFLRDYLYIPLGGNRRGNVRRNLNLLVTMLLGGLWHGAGWTFVIWGGLHGLMLMVNHQWHRLSITIPRVAAWLITFLSVMIAWVIFRCPTLADAGDILSAMAGWQNALLVHPLGTGSVKVAAVALALLAWCIFAPPMRWYAVRRRPSLLITFLAAAMLVLSVLNIAKPSQFLYFQF